MKKNVYTYILFHKTMIVISTELLMLTYLDNNIY